MSTASQVGAGPSMEPTTIKVTSEMIDHMKVAMIIILTMQWAFSFVIVGSSMFLGIVPWSMIVPVAFLCYTSFTLALAVSLWRQFITKLALLN